MLGSLLEKKTSKQKQRQRQQIRKTKDTKKTIFSPKKVDGQKTKEKRRNFEREDKRKTRKQNRINAKKDFKDRPLGGHKKQL